MKSLLLVLSSVILFTLSFPNFITGDGIPFIVFIALVPLFIGVENCKTPRAAARLGSLFGILSTTASYSWLMRYGEFSVWTLGGTALVYLFFYRLLFLFIYKLFKTLNPERVVVPLSIAWVVFEHFKSIGFLGFPWNLLGHSLHRWNTLIQIADIGGVLMLSFWCVLINATIASIIIRSCQTNPSYAVAKKPVAAAVFPRTFFLSSTRIGSFASYLTYTGLILVSLCVFMVYGSKRSVEVQDHYQKASNKFSALLVQQNIDSWSNQKFSISLKKVMNQTRESLNKLAVKPDIIVWSETSLRFPYQPQLFPPSKEYYESNPQDDSFTNFLREIDTPLLSGSPLYDSSGTKGYNGAVLINPDGTIQGVDKKRHLVPFAEIIPFKALLRQFVKNIVGLWLGWEASNDFSPILARIGSFDALPIATPICFEDAFSQVTRSLALNGTKVFFNLTNVSWARSPLTAKQQITAAVFRSIETRIPTLRGTNSGITTRIDALGRRGAQLDQFVEASMVVEVPVPDSALSTVYLSYGDWFAYMMISLWAITVIVLLVREYGLFAYRHKKT